MTTPAQIESSELVVTPLPFIARKDHWFDSIWSREIWKLKEGLEVQCANGGRWEAGFYFHILVPAGFVTDFASVPRPIQALLSEHSINSKAAVVHDWLYFEGCDEQIANGIFYALLKYEGIGWFDRWVMYLAVLFFGGSAYDAHRKANHPNVPLDQAQIS